jgi:GR25 family glycosyltransferase involved in LPS biosynthesis
MGFSDYFDKIYINHLPERKDREESIKYQFNYLQASYQFFDAIRHQDGSVGNKLSFIKILEDAMTKNYKNILFCEDDVLLRRCINEDIYSIKQDIHKENFDILCFHHPHPYEVPTSDRLTVKIRKPWCNHFMYLNNIEKIHKHVKDRESNHHGLDFTLVNSNLNCYITLKEYAMQLDDYSDIGKKVVRRFKHQGNYSDLLKKSII